jgi:hypothetical protein
MKIVASVRDPPHRYAKRCGRGPFVPARRTVSATGKISDDERRPRNYRTEGMGVTEWLRGWNLQSQDYSSSCSCEDQRNLLKILLFQIGLRGDFFRTNSWAALFHGYRAQAAG